MAMDFWGPLRLVLQTIQELQGDSSGFVRDSAFALKARMPLKNVQNCLIVLHENEFISLNKLGDGFSASIEAKGRVALTYPSNVPVVAWSTVQIVPKGLRPFDGNDSTFFLDLLPGPRDARGLPEGISYWKDGIEERDGDRTFRVGVIYGPSGCGKSSMVKAGLMPSLTDDILVVDVEATPEQTESLLLRSIEKKCPALIGRGMTQAFFDLSRGAGLPQGKTKILLLIDQFEQWLLSHRTDDTEDASELVASLKQCNGTFVQAIVMVRDEFWMALTRFMEVLGVEIRQDLNYRAVDLFGQRHAKKVLMLLGQGYGALPMSAENMTTHERQFLENAVEELKKEDKGKRIAPVRLSLFAQMLSEMEWSPSTLHNIGGAEGVGVEFLKETFDSERGRRRHKLSVRDADVCAQILEDLLPKPGSDIKKR
jgi:eukaryotic-like serine/threonine-protein kinase